VRLDLYLVQKGFCRSRDRAKGFIVAGVCKVNGRSVTKPAYSVEESDSVELIKEDFPYVGRGGLKLEKALADFGISVEGAVCVDVGVATGGFTDCLLQAGAKKVYAIDVGMGQLHDSLRQDTRVVFLPDTDIRHVGASLFQEIPDLIVVDVSFISVTLILSALKRISNARTDFVFLIKPQYEVGKKHSGVIRDEQMVQSLLIKVRVSFSEQGFDILREAESPITGKDGNKEFLWHVRF